MSTAESDANGTHGSYLGVTSMTGTFHAWVHALQMVGQRDRIWSRLEPKSTGEDFGLPIMVCHHSLGVRHGGPGLAVYGPPTSFGSGRGTAASR